MVALDRSLIMLAIAKKRLNRRCRAAMGKRYFDVSAQFILDSF